MNRVCTIVLAALVARAGDAVAQGPSLAIADTGRPRVARASPGYDTRLTIHRIGSYTMLPLFVGEYALGQRLLTGVNVPTWYKPAHTDIAVGLSSLFVVNTVTGVWNFLESRHEASGRTLRWIHSGLLLLSEAGFVYTESLGKGARTSFETARRHKNFAIASMSVSTAGTMLMWFVKH